MDYFLPYSYLPVDIKTEFMKKNRCLAFNFLFQDW